MRFLNGCIYKAMLFYKMENELNQLEKELLCQSPKEIHKSAYELTFKRELLLLFGESSTDFLTEDIQAALRFGVSLAGVISGVA